MNKMRMRRDWNRFKRKQIRVYDFVSKHREEMPLAKECELCPEDDKCQDNLGRHHPDYDEPWIYVTLCLKCHKGIHKASRE